MTARNRWFRPQSVSALALILYGPIAWTTRFLPAQTAAAQYTLQPSFDQVIKPFFNQN
jgi:hypothetical protein